MSWKLIEVRLPRSGAGPLSGSGLFLANLIWNPSQGRETGGLQMRFNSIWSNNIFRETHVIFAPKGGPDSTPLNTTASSANRRVGRQLKFCTENHSRNPHLLASRKVNLNLDSKLRAGEESQSQDTRVHGLRRRRFLSRNEQCLFTRSPF